MLKLRGLVLSFIVLLGGACSAEAACVLPHQLTNGQIADAEHVMANFNALIGCLAPAGSQYSLQYNDGSGSMGGIAPLVNGQVVVGSTGNAPQPATLTAGSGIAISNGPGSITISATGGGGTSWTVVTSDITAAPGGMYLVDTSAGPITITLPISGVVEIRDAKGTFGVNNVIIAAANGQTLSGVTYAAAPMVTLNAPGNNATILCESAVAYVNQVASGVWNRTAPTGAASVAWTGLPARMAWRLIGDGVSSSTTAQMLAVVGTGIEPTYKTSGYGYGLLNFYTMAAGTGHAQAYLTYAPVVDTLVSIDVTIQPNFGASEYITITGQSNSYRTYSFNSVAPSGDLTAFKVYYSAGTISASSLTLLWSKLNI